MPNKTTPTVKLGPWRPVGDSTDTSVVLEAENVVYEDGIYKPFHSFLDFGSVQEPLALNAVVTGTGKLVVGTPSGLYRGDVNGPLSPAEVTSGVTYWRFQTWGDGCLALSSAGNLYFVPDTGATVHCYLDASMKYLFRVNGFAVLGADYNLQWSALNDPTDFTPAQTTMADVSQLSKEHGKFMGAVEAGNSAVIFQENAIHLMQFVGPPTVFNMGTPITETKGLVYPGACLKTPAGIFALCQDGPNLVGGEGLTPIMNGVFADYFSGVLNTLGNNSLSMALDYKHNCVVVFWGTEGFIWNWKTQQASVLKPEEELSFVFNSGEGNNQAPAYVFNTSGDLGTFEGTPEAAFVRGPFISPGSSRRALVNEAWIDCDANNISVSHLTRASKAANVKSTVRAASLVDSNGKVSIRASARQHALGISIPSQDWSELKSFQLGFQLEGRR